MRVITMNAVAKNGYIGFTPGGQHQEFMRPRWKSVQFPLDREGFRIKKQDAVALLINRQ